MAFPNGVRNVAVNGICRANAINSGFFFYLRILKETKLTAYDVVIKELLNHI